MRRWSFASACVIACMLLPLSATAKATKTCGGTGTAEEPPLGTLVLGLTDTTTSREFLGNNSENLLLWFDLQKCLMGPTIAREIAIDYIFADVPPGAFKLREEAVHARDDEVWWVVSVDSSEFDGGVHEGKIVIGGKETIVHRVQVPLS